MTTVYLLWHGHDLGDGDSDDKLIGVYGSNQEAELARERTQALPGFRDAPDGFVVDPYPVGRDHWTSGYLTLSPGRTPWDDNAGR